MRQYFIGRARQSEKNTGKERRKVGISFILLRMFMLLYVKLSIVLYLGDALRAMDSLCPAGNVTEAWNSCETSWNITLTWQTRNLNIYL